MSLSEFEWPFGPERGGKIQRPQDKREQERQERQLRGCFDPNCVICNPETAGRGIPSPGPFTLPVDPAGFRDSVVFSFDGSASYAFVDGAASLNLDPGGKASAPPQSYADARKPVEKWLAKAPEQAFDDIVGNDAALEQLRDAIQAPVKHKALYDAYGMTMPKGAMLSGPPGCGKTMFARAAAAEMKRLHGDKVEFISISGSELQSPFVGVTEGHIKAIFDFAREYKAFHGHPLLVFMDEADVLLPDRTGRIRRVASWEESQVATFLAEMDGMRESGAFVLLATNRPEVIDQAVLRDGRCDFKIVVKRPSPAAIERILRNHFAGILTGADNEDALVFAAAECLFDPQKVIAAAHEITIKLGAAGLDVKDEVKKHFLLEHIVSGAMAASVPGRAKRYAFARDKASGVAAGVTVVDVVRAVNDLFEENKRLDHSFALKDFMAELAKERADEARIGDESRG